MKCKFILVLYNYGGEELKQAIDFFLFPQTQVYACLMSSPCCVSTVLVASPGCCGVSADPAARCILVTHRVAAILCALHSCAGAHSLMQHLLRDSVLALLTVGMGALSVPSLRRLSL